MVPTVLIIIAVRIVAAVRRTVVHRGWGDKVRDMSNWYTKYSIATDNDHGGVSSRPHRLSTNPRSYKSVVRICLHDIMI